MHPEMERIQNCLAAVRRHTDFVPEVAVVLGSGLGGFDDMGIGDIFEADRRCAVQ